jgi:hypothetical protein
MLAQAQDTIIMKNGNVYTGKVQVISEDNIQIIDGGQSNIIPRNGIKSVRFENSGKDAIYVNLIDINGLDIEFIQIVGIQKGMFSSDVKVSIDYGQHWKFFGKQQLITDNIGHQMVFNSVIAALNYFTKHGWDFVSAYPMSSQQGAAYHYLLRKHKD